MEHDELCLRRGSLSGAALGLLLVLGGCSHDWDTYDPRLGATGSSGSSGSSVGSSTSSSSGAGGGGGGGASAYAALVLGDGPIGYWRLGEKSGITAKDELGAHPGTYVGAVQYGQPGAIAGEKDTAMLLDCGDTSVQVGDAFGFPGNARFTIEAWVSPTYLGSGHRRIASKEDPYAAGGRQGYMLFARSLADPKTGFERWVNDSVQGAVYTTTALALDAYNYVVVTYDGVTLVLYLNNQIMDTQPASVPLVDHAGPFVWAAGSDPTFESGSHICAALDEVVVYDKALSPAQVDAHYKAATGP
jgi:hypothetical protein